MKNSSRKSGGSAAPNKKQSSRKSSAGAGKKGSSYEKAQTEQELMQAAKAKDKDAQQEVLFKVETRRDSGVLLAFITFTYRVFHPQVTARLILYGLLVLTPGFLIDIKWLKVVLWAAGAVMVLLGLFRQYISLLISRSSDQDYRNGTLFTYEFTQNDASFYSGDELTAYSNRYKNIDAIYHDEKYYYLSLTSRAFFVLPKDRFVTGDPAEFGDFMYKKCKKTCRWIPARLGNRIRKMQSRRAVAREQKNRK